MSVSAEIVLLKLSLVGILKWGKQPSKLPVLLLQLEFLLNRGWLLCARSLSGVGACCCCLLGGSKTTLKLIMDGVRTLFAAPTGRAKILSCIASELDIDASLGIAMVFLISQTHYNERCLFVWSASRLAHSNSNLNLRCLIGLSVVSWVGVKPRC